MNKTFLDYVRSTLCAHKNESFRVVNKQYVTCSECGHTLDVYEHIKDFESDPFFSQTLANSFGQLSGNIDVPCHVFVMVDGVLPRSIFIKLSTVCRGIKLLKALNSPFYYYGKDFKINKTLFTNLMTEYMHLINRVCKAGDDDMMAIRAILTNMKDVFAEINLFDQYFDILVPYVKSLGVDCSGLNEMRQPEEFGETLYLEMRRASTVRKTFSQYCIPFDVAYVMVCCFLFGDEAEVVYNLVLDLGGRICTGYFSNIHAFLAAPVTSHLRGQIETFLSKHVTPTKNVALYYHLQKYARNEVEECFSEDFLKNFGVLDDGIRKYLGFQDDDKLSKFTYQQTFPFLLFGDKDTEFFGFVVALAHYVSKKPPVEKGVVSHSRRIFRFVKRCMERVRAFRRSSDDTQFFWTKDVFTLFLCSDGAFEKELKTVLNMVLTSD